MVASFRSRRSLVQLAESFEITARSRFTNRQYDKTRNVSGPILRRILELGQLAPTSFNLQPFQYLVVRSEEAKDLLASSMIGNNSRIVTATPISVAFLAENDLARNAKDLMNLERSFGTDPNYVASLPAKLNFLLGSGHIARGLKKVASHLLSPLQPMPVIDIDNRAWAAKNVGFVAQQVMLACTAYGLASTPMEGFDERRLCHQLQIPLDKFSVPLVLSIGYIQGTSDEGVLDVPIDVDNIRAPDGDTPVQYPKKPRFSLESRCYENKYGGKISF